jgi:DNA-binding CsgD family transcriptional regulator
VATWSQLGDTGHFVSGSSAVAACGIAAGRYALARDAAEAAVIGADRLDDEWDRARAITMTGGLLVAAGRGAEGVRLLGYGEAVMSRLGTPLSPWMSSQVDSYRVVAGAVIGDMELVRQTAVGAALSTDEATEEAIAALESLRNFWPDERVTRPDLSRRERDVLALLAQGKTDREIADALFIERRTVSKHVAAILEKLDVPNRSAAAALGLRLGIV